MKLKLPLFVLLLCRLGASAQQLPQYTQYTFNELLINPAVTGVESYWDIKSGFRSQWTGLQGAPQTTYLTLSVPLGKTFTENDYSQMIRNTDNPIGRNDALSYSASADHHGVGLSLVSDKTGQIRQTHIDATYAYHLKLNDVTNFSAGASFGINSINLNTSQITLVNPLDPAIYGGNSNQIQPEAALGVWLYSARYFIGASAQQLLPSTISFNNVSVLNQGKTYAQYFFTAGYKLFVSDDVTALPSVVFKPFDKGPLSFDANIKFAFKDVFWVGGSYRKDDAASASFGFNLGGYMSLGYSYDYTTSPLNNVSNGTHEIMLGLFLKNNYNVTSPRHTW